MSTVSVLMPVYNCSKFLNESLDSILGQSYNDIEVIIVDDGSTDNSVAIINKYNDRRIKLFAIKHSGPPSALNYGISKASGELIARVDADDFIHPDRIKIQYEFLKRNPGYGVVGTNFIYIDEAGKRLSKIKLPEDSKVISDQLTRKISISHPTLMYRKEIVLSAGGYNEKQVIDDWDLYLRLLGKTKFCNIQEYLTFVRDRKNSYSKQADYNLEAEKLLKEYFNKIISGNENKSSIAKTYFDMGYFLYYENKLDASLPYFENALRNDPGNLLYKRYYYINKYLKNSVKFIRKHKLYKIYEPLKYFDPNNRIFRNKF